MRAVIYARYSSDLQSAASIEDQIRVCRDRIEREGWTLEATYCDHAISGASTLRPGYQRLLEDARAGRFDVVVSEALDRLSRDQENIAALYKQLSFAEIRLVTVADGEINELHVGLKGTMNALFLKDLAQKTRRGLEGRVRAGRSAGGNAYGYKVVDERTADGTPVRGKRRICPDEAGVIRRIFLSYTHGRSPKSIALELNREGLPGPAGKVWGPSTIYGNWRRGTGILNNEFYVGRLVWNRQRFIKDPMTGRRQARLNPPEDWIVEEVPDLRIVDEELWQSVKRRQLETRNTVVSADDGVRPERARRPRYLLSGLLKCGTCGGGFSMINKTRYGCSRARNTGTCDNMMTIRREDLEQRVLDGLKSRLMQPDTVKAFIEEFQREANSIAANRDFERNRLETDLGKTRRDIARVIQAIKDGVPGSVVKDEITELEARRAELERALAQAPAPMPRLHPKLAELYREKVADLQTCLNRGNSRDEAAEAIRGLIEEIRLIPQGKGLTVELYGELAALLQLGIKHPRRSPTGVQVTLVAGVGFEPTTFRL